MCGINGIINFKSEKVEGKKIIERMNSVLTHRGPDEEGYFFSSDNKVIFGNRRLDIVDVKNGQLPFVYKTEKAEYALAFNGEIFNYKELREVLKKQGHQFTTNSDSEVLLKSYIEWGVKCLDKFNGEFAFAIYDSNKNAVFLARDPVGVKPLFYTILEDKTLIFSSEPKGILQHTSVKREPDNEMIADFFLGMMTFADFSETLDRSFFKNIYSINPGNYAIFDKSGLKEKQYSNINIQSKKSKKRKFAAEFREKLESAIKMRIPDEVNFGTALSGGIDSSIVTAVTAKNKKDFIVTSAKFVGDDENIDFSHAELLAEKYKIKITPTVLSPQALMSAIDPMVRAMDSPHDAMRQLSLFLIYKLMHDEKCKVVLVGEGADEFNLGYYHYMAGYERDEKAIKGVKDFEKILNNRAKFASKFFATKFLKSVNFKKIIKNNYSKIYSECKSKDPIEKMQYFHLKRFLKYRLDANDRCGMAHSIEARVPFCDKEVVEVSLSVPKKLNISKGGEKQIEKEAFKDIIPKEIIERKKYPLPESKNLEFYDLIRRELDKNIASADLKIWEILDKNYVVSLNKELEKIIKELKESGKPATELTSEIPMSKPVQLRMKYIFSVLTLIRWYAIYF